MTSKKTPHATVIGWPIKHSKSPILHGYWLDHYQLDGRYDRTEVPPDRLCDFVENLRTLAMAGANVTIPHKQAILQFVDVVEPTAARLQAANTLWFENEQLHATNTDAFGFIAHLDASCPNWQSRTKTALVIGAGGASRAIIDVLCERGIATLKIANRSLDRAEMVKSHFAPYWPNTDIEVVTSDQISDLVRASDLVVNTTSLGMVGQPPLEVDFQGASPATIVYDLVYTPLETPFLRSAKAAGLQTVDGLGMLLHQGRPGFKHWFGAVESQDGLPQVTDALRTVMLKG